MTAPRCIKFNKDVGYFLYETMKIPPIQNSHIIIPKYIAIPGSQSPHIIKVIFSIYSLANSQKQIIDFGLNLFLRISFLALQIDTTIYKYEKYEYCKRSADSKSAVRHQFMTVKWIYLLFILA